VRGILQGRQDLRALGRERREVGLQHHRLQVARRQADVAGDLMRVGFAHGPFGRELLAPRLGGDDAGPEGAQLRLDLRLLLLERRYLGGQVRAVGQDGGFLLGVTGFGGGAFLVGLAEGFAQVLRGSRHGGCCEHCGGERGRDNRCRTQSVGESVHRLILPIGSETSSFARRLAAISIEWAITRLVDAGSSIQARCAGSQVPARLPSGLRQ
jgi:hypothetical protein